MIGQFRPAWLHLGYALRSAIDMGLHHRKRGPTPNSHHELLKRAFWYAFAFSI